MIGESTNSVNWVYVHAMTGYILYKIRQRSDGCYDVQEKDTETDQWRITGKVSLAYADAEFCSKQTCDILLRLLDAEIQHV